ncbi:ABC transporter ATP-binding protein [bacterium]|nr:ABC transporter ATP-binding protein [bacterium]
MSSVDIRELNLDFGSVSVLRNLNLSVNEGEFLVLLGPSGCGKSTLLNCIAGLLDISDGQIFINNNNVTWAEPKDRGIGMVFQSYALYPQMTVEKNLSFSLRVAGLPKAEVKKRVDRAAEILQIEALLKRKPSALSGGQRQRVAIGRALVRDVDVFLFDEPLSNLDAKLRTDLRVELKRLHKRLGNTMIYVTHDQIEALTLADRIAIMKGGIIQQLDTPNGIYHKPKNRFVAGFIGSPSMNFLKGTIERSDNEWIFKADQAGSSNPSLNDISLARYEFVNEPSQGQAVEFGIRPEHIELGEQVAPLPAQQSFSVELIEPMGSDAVVWGAFNDSAITIRMDADKVPDVTVRHAAGFDPARASIFDTGTGDRL